MLIQCSLMVGRYSTKLEGQFSSQGYLKFNSNSYKFNVIPNRLQSKLHTTAGNHLNTYWHVIKIYHTCVLKKIHSQITKKEWHAI